MSHIKTVTFNRAEYIELITRVISNLELRKQARDVEIEEWKANNFTHDLEIVKLKHEYYLFSVQYDTLMTAHENNSNLVEDLIDLKYNLTIFPAKTQKYKTISKPRKVERKVEKGFWATLFQPDEYVTETEYDLVDVTDGYDTESFESFWARIDEEIKTPKFDTSYELLKFYEDRLIPTSSHGWPFISFSFDIEPETYNHYDEPLNNLQADLASVLAAPDATYSIDGNTLDSYTRIIESK